jgi:N-acyl-D-aspartate/D-glutamate deacylase
MLGLRLTVPGLVDGGAHVGFIGDASFPTTLLSYWARDRSDLPEFDLPWAIARQCRGTAKMVGLLDRGLLAPGLKADVNVIDLVRLAARAPHIVTDLPAGGLRAMQGADGYLHTSVSRREVYAEGDAPGELPGALVRGAQRPVR